MQPVLKHSGFSQLLRFLLLKQNLWLEITCQPNQENQLVAEKRSWYITPSAKRKMARNLSSPKRSKNFCWLGCTRVWSTVVTPSASDSFFSKEPWIGNYSTHRQVAVRISPPWLKSLTDLFLVRSEITCHIIVSCQKNCLFAVAQHNIFELAPTWNNEDSSHILGEFNFQTKKIYQNASNCKERNELNSTKLRIQQLSYSGASGCGTALRI